MDDGVRVTDPARTVVDLSRHVDRGWALAAADAARRRWRVSTARLRDAAERNPCAPGHPAAVWVAQNARREAESPLESLARSVVLLAGRPEPRLQVWIGEPSLGYRVDLLDDERFLIIEADGRLKYARPEDVWAEKRRQDRLLAWGYQVQRFVLEDYRRPRQWLAEGDAIAARRAQPPA